MELSLRRQISKDQSRDTGMAMVLLCFILFGLRKRGWLLGVGATLHIVNMILPNIYKPVAVVWLTLSDLLGAVVSKVFMSLVFFGVVTPLGTLRRMLGKDSLQLRSFKASESSVMLERNHLFVCGDIEKPY